jgi:hypothetical protein
MPEIIFTMSIVLQITNTDQDDSGEEVALWRLTSVSRSSQNWSKTRLVAKKGGCI